MKRKDWIFIIGVIAVTVFFVLLSRYGGRTPPALSAIPGHDVGQSRQDCLICHDPEGVVAVRPISKDHPQAWKDERFSCTVCHKQAK